jgi:hypothetical protein
LFLIASCFGREIISRNGQISETVAKDIQQTITDMISHQVKKKGEPATRAYTTRRDWLAFLKEVSKKYFNPLMPNKSGILYYYDYLSVYYQFSGCDFGELKIALCAAIRMYINGKVLWLKYIPDEAGAVPLDIALITNKRKENFNY